MANEQNQQGAQPTQQPESTGLVALGANEKGKVSYEVAGQTVNLSYTIVRNYLTKGNSAVSDADLTQFISICKYQQLNPFLGEAYLVKYGTQPAQMITSKEALMKRAEANEHYQGFEAGVIVIREGKCVDLEGSFYLDTDTLVGGWAKVFRDDRKPVISRVRLSEYDKKQSTWNEKKSTMIKKVALVQALREAFPAQLGALYSVEERQEPDDQQQPEIVDAVAQEVRSEVEQQANAGDPVGFEAPAQDPNEAPAPEPVPSEPAPSKRQNKREMGF